MIQCSNCQHEQEAGNFCELCGQPIFNDQEKAEEAAAGVESEPDEQRRKAVMQQPNTSQTGQSTQHMQQAKQQTENVWTQYWHYFFTLLKNPTETFRMNENQFNYSLVTIGLYCLSFSFSVYFLANSLANSFGSYFGESTSLPFAIVFRLIIFMVISLAIPFFSAFTVIKLAKNTSTFQKSLTQFAGLLVPFTVLHAIGFLGGLTGGIRLTMIPVMISLIFTISYVPVLFVYEKTATPTSTNQRVYLSLLTVVISSLLFIIIGDIWLMDSFENLEDTLDYPF